MFILFTYLLAVQWALPMHILRIFSHANLTGSCHFLGHSPPQHMYEGYTKTRTCMLYTIFVLHYILLSCTVLYSSVQLYCLPKIIKGDRCPCLDQSIKKTVLNRGRIHHWVCELAQEMPHIKSSLKFTFSSHKTFKFKFFQNLSSKIVPNIYFVVKKHLNATNFIFKPNISRTCSRTHWWIRLLAIFAYYIESLLEAHCKLPFPPHHTLVWLYRG